MQLILVGSTGAVVKDIQVLLNHLKPIVPKLVEDGIFGSKTRSSVIKFQQPYELSADGIIGTQTGQALVSVTGLRLKQGIAQ